MSIYRTPLATTATLALTVGALVSSQAAAAAN